MCWNEFHEKVKFWVDTREMAWCFGMKKIDGSRSKVGKETLLVFEWTVGF